MTAPLNGLRVLVVEDQHLLARETISARPLAHTAGPRHQWAGRARPWTPCSRARQPIPVQGEAEVLAIVAGLVRTDV